MPPGASDGRHQPHDPALSVQATHTSATDFSFPVLPYNGARINHVGQRQSVVFDPSNPLFGLTQRTPPTSARLFIATYYVRVIYRPTGAGGWLNFTHSVQHRAVHGRHCPHSCRSRSARSQTIHSDDSAVGRQRRLLQLHGADGRPGPASPDDDCGDGAVRGAGLLGLSTPPCPPALWWSTTQRFPVARTTTTSTAPSVAVRARKSLTLTLSATDNTALLAWTNAVFQRPEQRILFCRIRQYHSTVYGTVVTAHCHEQPRARPAGMPAALAGLRGADRPGAAVQRSVLSPSTASSRRSVVDATDASALS